MRYISLFSGIEAASVAWEPLGWRPVAFAEMEPFPSAVLAARWPEVPNLGDVTKVDWSEYRGKADVVVGGSPCQSFSVAGLRNGLADPRGNLMLEFLRACSLVEPEWVVWENVPGVLSSGGGSDFQAFLEAVVELWPRGGVAWRVLDARFFGVAQRRRRVFAVVNARDWRRAACVLQEPGCLFGDRPSSREKGEELARAAGRRAPRHLRGEAEARSPEHDRVAGFMGGQSRTSGSLGYRPEVSPTIRGAASGTNSVPSVLAFAQDARDEARIQGGGDVSGALAAHPGMKQTTCVMHVANTVPGGASVSCEDASHTIDTANDQAVLTQYGEDIAGTLAARADSSPCSDRGQNVLCLGVIPENAIGRPDSGTNGPVAYGPSEPSPTLRASRDVPAVVASDGAGVDPNDWVVRGLTPVECERLQGFGDGHTDLTGCDAEAALARIPMPGDPRRRRQVERNVRRWCARCPDGPRYKACGNSMAVPVMEWIGRRIEMVGELVIELMSEGDA